MSSLFVTQAAEKEHLRNRRRWRSGRHWWIRWWAGCGNGQRDINPGPDVVTVQSPSVCSQQSQSIRSCEGASPVTCSVIVKITGPI
eukprot:3095190-Prymnesium_polylepis.1